MFLKDITRAILYSETLPQLFDVYSVVGTIFNIIQDQAEVDRLKHAVFFMGCACLPHYFIRKTREWLFET